MSTPLHRLVDALGELDAYRVLGLGPTASAAEGKRAYRRLVRIHHPDVTGRPATPLWDRISAAHELLDVHRPEYDAFLARRRRGADRPPGPGPARPAGPRPGPRPARGPSRVNRRAVRAIALFWLPVVPVVHALTALAEIRASGERGLVLARVGLVLGVLYTVGWPVSLLLRWL